MKLKIFWVLYLACSLTSHASDDEAKTRPDYSRALDRCEMLDSRLEQSSRNLAALLNANPVTPEERAILIERWQKEQEPLQQQARAARAALAASRKYAAPASPAPETVTNDPVLAEIEEIEAGVKAFQESLETANPTPEQRAIWIEQFHELNRETLRHLGTLKRQAATKAHAADASVTPGTEIQADASSQAALLKAELDRVMRDLSQVDPETRARYLETHATTLRTMLNHAMTPNQNNHIDQ